MKKVIELKTVLAFLIGTVLTGTIVYAADILTSADSISYNDNQTVADALDDLLGSGDATAANILADKQAFVNGELLTGTMPNLGAWTSAPSLTDPDNKNVTIPAGYHNGSGYIDTTNIWQDGYDTGYGAGVNEKHTTTYKLGTGNSYNQQDFTISSDINVTDLTIDNFKLEIVSVNIDGGGYSSISGLPAKSFSPESRTLTVTSFGRTFTAQSGGKVRATCSYNVWLIV